VGEIRQQEASADNRQQSTSGSATNENTWYLLTLHNFAAILFWTSSPTHAQSTVISSSAQVSQTTRLSRHNSPSVSPKRTVSGQPFRPYWRNLVSSCPAQLQSAMTAALRAWQTTAKQLHRRSIRRLPAAELQLLLETTVESTRLQSRAIFSVTWRHRNRTAARRILRP
jgi:formate dehydrogenase maturation protein FdhE